MLNRIVFLHHLSIEFMGREFAPRGLTQHLMVIVLTAVALSFAIYGFVTFLQKFLLSDSKKREGLLENKLLRGKRA